MVSHWNTETSDRLQSTYRVARNERAREDPVHHDSRTREAIGRDIRGGDRQVSDRADSTGDETSVGQGKGDEPCKGRELAHSVAMSEMRSNCERIREAAKHRAELLVGQGDMSKALYPQAAMSGMEPRHRVVLRHEISVVCSSRRWRTPPDRGSLEAL